MTAQPSHAPTPQADREPADNEHVLYEIPSRWRSKPWFEDDSVASVPRREDLFIDPVYAQAVCRTAAAGGKTIHVAWLSLVEDEDAGRDVPIERAATDVIVMDVEGYYPHGWAYVMIPGLGSQIVPMDVITDIGIEL